MRNILIGLIIVILVSVGALLWGVANLDNIVEAAIEENGSAMTGTAVRVDAVSIGLTEGSAQVEALTIANPKGFSTANAFALESIRATFDPRTSLEVMVIDELRIEKPVIVYEIGAQGNNLEKLQKTVEQSLGSDGRTGGKAGTPSGAPQPKFIINTLVITKGKMKLNTSADKIGSSDIPAIRLNNVGKREGGLTGAQVGKVIINAISDKTIQTVTQGGIDKYLDDIKDKVKGLFD